MILRHGCLGTPWNLNTKMVPKYKDIFISYEEDPRIVGIIVGNFVPMEG